MERHGTLNTLLDSLFTSNQLKNWTIFEEKSGSILVKLRFTNTDMDSNTATVTESPIAFKRKSCKQVSRDRERAARHKDARVGATTRGMASAYPTSPELPRSAETDSISKTVPLDISADSVLNRSTLSVCSAMRDRSLSCDNSINSLDHNNDSTTLTYSEDIANEQTHSETDSLSDSDSDDMPPVPLLPPISDPRGISRKFRCLQPNCFYGGTDKRYEVRDGEIVVIPLDPPDPMVLKCAACPGSTVYVCRNCNSRGRHEGHNPWLRLTNIDTD